MKPKQPSNSDEEKTAIVGSGRKSSQTAPLGDQSTVHDQGALGESPSVQDDSKTTYVDLSSSLQSDRSTNSRHDDSSGRIRSDPSPRLEWPARDQRSPLLQQPKRSDIEANPNLKGMQEDERTRLYNPVVNVDVNATNNKPVTGIGSAGASIDPVVGWLVIVEGPGKGRSIEVGVGANSIGRDHNQKVSVDFGDQHISRDRHAILVFDPKSCRFFLQAGDVRNLTYIGDELVLSPTELKGGETIVVGQTKLRFVGFCGPEFNWS
jgi:hypothetical protein